MLPERLLWKQESLLKIKFQNVEKIVDNGFEMIYKSECNADLTKIAKNSR